jgi:hypothetical protein
MLSRSQGHSAANDLIENRIHDLPVCSIVPHPTTLPRGPVNLLHRRNYLAHPSVFQRSGLTVDKTCCVRQILAKNGSTVGQYVTSLSSRKPAIELAGKYFTELFGFFGLYPSSGKWKFYKNHNVSEIETSSF